MCMGQSASVIVIAQHKSSDIQMMVEDISVLIIESCRKFNCQHCSLVAVISCTL